MNIVITNHLSVAVPVMSKDEGGWCEQIEPGIPLTISRDLSNDCIIGDKPDVSEQILEGLGTAVDVVKKLLTLRKPTPTGHAAEEPLNCIIGNNGPNSIRVILGDGQTANDVAPGVSYQALSPRYIEIRELGLVNEPGGTPD